jgi:hypothetical protein
VRAVTDVRLGVRLPKDKEHATAVASDGTRVELELRVDAGVHTVTLERLGVYSIVVFHDGEL